MTAETLLSRLTKVKRTGKENWLACCPAHQDKNPSMTIRETSDGRVLVHCFAGCETSDILAAVGLQFSDLFPEPLGQFKSMRRPFPAADVLEAVATEAQIAALVASDIAAGRSVSTSDRERLGVAVSRLSEAREIANG